MATVSCDPEPARPVARRFPARVEALREIRRFVADLAAAAGVGGESRSAVVLAVHEAAANAVEHSGGDAVTVRWERGDRAVDVAVHDNGVFQEHSRRVEGRGRGLGLLLGLADAVSVRPGQPGAPGTRVRLRFQVTPPASPRSASPARAAPRPWVLRARRTLLTHLPAGYALFDRQLRFLEINETLAAMNGLPVSAHLGRRVHDVLPAGADVLVRRFRRVLETGRALQEAEVSARLPGDPVGERHWLHSVYPVPGPDGSPIGLAVLVTETTEVRTAQRAAAARQAAECDAGRLRLLQRLTEALAAVLDTTQVARTITTTVPAELGADGGALVLADGASGFRPAAVTGFSDREIRSVRDPTGADGGPKALVVKSGRPVFISCAEEWDERFPARRGFRRPFQALAMLPLRTGDAVAGVVTFGWRQPREFTGDDIDLLSAVAAQAAVALERARLYDAEHAALRSTRQAQRRLTLLAEASAQLAAATREGDQLGRLGELLVRWLGEQCTILLAGEDGVLRRHTVRSSEPGHGALASALQGTVLAPVPDDDPRMVAWRSGRTVLGRLDRLEPHLGGVGSTEADQITATCRDGWVMVAPLVARGQRLGVLTVWRSSGARPFDDEDADLLTDLGRRAGTAVDNTRLLAARTRAAARLQDTLLPARMPAVDGVELAPRYLTAEDAADVGGDLYDVFPTGDGGFALVIGDVAGRGVDAAGLTGLARATLRALAGHPVEAALVRLNALLAERTGGERFLTLAYLLLRPDADGADLRVWLAGHPQPALVRAHGTVEAVGTPGTLLGILPEVTHVRAGLRLDRGDLLLLYTDGITEARGPDGMFGVTRLPALLAGLAGCPASVAVDRIEQAVAEYRRGSADDAAILAVRLTPLAEPREQALLELRSSAEPAEVAAVAAAVAGCTAALAPAERVGAVAESVAAVLHHVHLDLITAGPRGLRPDPVQLRVLHRGDVVRIEISWPGPRAGAEAPRPAAGGPPRATEDAWPPWPTRLRLPEGVVAELNPGTAGGPTGIRLEVRCRP